MDHRTPDLFAAASPAAGAVPAFGSAFDAWAAAARRDGRLAEASSERVYRDMWSAFAAWCLGQDPLVTLDTLASTDLTRFLASRPGTTPGGALTTRHAWRLLNLIERVLTHRAATTRDAPRANAAAELLAGNDTLRRANLEDRPLPDHLEADDARALVVFLSRTRPRAGGDQAARTWQELRNRASVALQLGAGLTPGDVRALPVDAPVIAGGRHAGVPWKLRVPGDGNRPARETPVAGWAGQLLRHWLEVRADVGFADAPGAAFLFPATRKGRAWGKVAQYEAVKQVLEAAGIHPLEGGSFRLRHTFALRQLRRGRTVEEVALWMGIADPAELGRYRRILLEPVDLA